MQLFSVAADNLCTLSGFPCRYQLVLFPVTNFVCELLNSSVGRESNRTELFYDDLEKLPQEEVARICEVSCQAPLQSRRLCVTMHILMHMHGVTGAGTVLTNGWIVLAVAARKGRWIRIKAEARGKGFGGGQPLLL